MRDVVLAVDIGGTKTAAALAGWDDAPRGTRTAPTPASAGPSAVIATVVGLARELLTADPDARLVGVGIGTAGVVDRATGAIVSSTDTFADWPGTPVAGLVREGLGLLLPKGAPIAVQNDVDAHALGEFVHGSAEGAHSVLVVAVGTGVGAGIILGDAPLSGAHHVGGEIAHLPVPGAAHLRCPCGRMGHLEAIGSGIGMHAHFRSLGGSADIVDARGIAAAADTDEIAARALAESAAAVGRAIAGAATIIDPERVVVTGGVPKIGGAWWRPMLEAFRAEAIDALQDTPILPGMLGDDAPLRGAAASAWRKL